MKSRTIMGLAVLMIPLVAPIRAQVLPLGAAPQHGGVRRACHDCAEPSAGFYGTTIWGTECWPCNSKPGLFPPCPNPCQTTLLGELVYDVRHVVDGTLSRVFGCVFGHPCGCRGACTCVASDCGSWGGEYLTSTMAGPSMMEPAGQPVPATESYGDPFRDEPTPSPPLQPVPAPSATRSLLPNAARTSAHQRGPVARPAPMARRASYEVPVPAVSSVEQVRLETPTMAANVKSPQPIVSVPRHYQPRRPVSVRRADGESLHQTPLRSNGSTPALRFRSAE